MFDVAVIGCGIVGAAVAERLARYQLKTLILEKENDVAMGTTRANSAILHAGYDAQPGTLMSRLNIRGAIMAKELCHRYDVAYNQLGSLVLAFDEADKATLQRLYKQGNEGGVPGLELWNQERILMEEPNLSNKVLEALYAPSAAIVDPWEYCLALAGSAVENGAQLQLGAAVTAISKKKDSFVISTTKGDYEASFIVNAAGVYADTLHNMALEPSFTIKPNKGEYYLLDKTEGQRVKHTIFQCPNENGKGVLVSPTAHGNLIVGPSSTPVENREDVSTTSAGLQFVVKQAGKSCPNIDYSASIRNFSGIRAATDTHDFVIRRTGRWVDLAGIQSPGLSAAPAIAEMAEELLAEGGLVLKEKPAYISERRVVRFASLPYEAQQQLAKETPAYGRIICRCENVTEGEILDALHSPIPPLSVDGVKRRCGTGMGRCQGGFCSPRIVELIAKARGVSPLEVLMDGEGSYILTGDMLEREGSHV